MMAENSALKKLLPDPRRLKNDLQNLQRSDYDHALEILVRELTKTSDVIFIGQFGLVKNPGISDLDVLVIAEDRNYKTVRAASRRITAEIPHSNYIFWHPVSVVPKSLLPASRLLHTFSNLRPLWGDATPANFSAANDPALKAISAALWNSYFWRCVCNLRNSRPSLRMLIFLLNNIAHSIAANNQLMEKPAVQLADARSAILAAPEKKRAELMVNYLSEFISQWHASEWQLQEWWTRHFEIQNVHPSAELRLTSKIHLRFAQHAGAEGEKISIATKAARLWRKQTGIIELTLPMFYLELILALKDLFPHLQSPALKKLEQKIQFQSSAHWQNAIATYAAAVTDVARFSGSFAVNEQTLFGEIFVSPFGF